MTCIERRRVARVRRMRMQPLPIYLRGIRMKRERSRYICLVDRHRCGTGRMVWCVAGDIFRFWTFRVNARIEKMFGGLR